MSDDYHIHGANTNNSTRGNYLYLQRSKHLLPLLKNCNLWFPLSFSDCCFFFLSGVNQRISGILSNAKKNARPFGMFARVKGHFQWCWFWSIFRKLETKPSLYLPCIPSNMSCKNFSNGTELQYPFVDYCLSTCHLPVWQSFVAFTALRSETLLLSLC